MRTREEIEEQLDKISKEYTSAWKISALNQIITNRLLLDIRDLLSIPNPTKDE